MSHYQQAGQVEQLQNERANAVAYGQDGRVAAIDKQLEGFGVKAEAAKERKAAAKLDDEDAKAKAPQGRSSKPTQKTD